ncbi:hypothetical protein SAMN05444411_104173 [Lutibacter oricola]|uniref:Uncharacterized protein n=1 Tax=Lutibacter oricola TaxID=762486 RepID=A0A1H3AMI7_9FLAO|nr:DUF4350 domain-containing protein [Lutibacter oricola]SDX30833.1 hypothetical protein SAMN05444411_104173 [Lutibacter oricola]
MTKFFKFLIVSVLFFSVSILSAQNVMYVYGDVSADGDIPSGDKKPFHQMRLTDTGNLGMSQFLEALEEVKLTVTEVYDQEIEFTLKSLKNIDVLILASNQRVFSKNEAKAVGKWVNNGGGLVVWSDSAFGGEYKLVGVDNPTGRISDNIITEQFGMHFLTDNGAGNYLVKEYTKNHFLNANNKNGGIRFRGEGVSFVRISPPAIMLAKAQEGGLGGKLRVNKNDGVFNAETDAALAIANIGKGRVVGLFDRNLFWNAGAGTRISHSDNREFTQRLMLYAAGIEDESRLPSDKKSVSKGINNPPIINITHVLKENKFVFVTSSIVDNDTDNKAPEIFWKQVKGPAQGIFENNNPNTLTPVIELPKQGVYRFQAIIKDGEFHFRKNIEVQKK